MKPTNHPNKKAKRHQTNKKEKQTHDIIEQTNIATITSILNQNNQATTKIKNKTTKQTKQTHSKLNKPNQSSRW